MMSDLLYQATVAPYKEREQELRQRIAELEAEITEIPTLCRAYEKALREKDKHHNVVIEQFGKRIAELEKRWEDVYLVGAQHEKLRKATWGQEQT
jgi:predicted RNase H-like nuclease (RuvC/YqgF family)